MSPPFGAGWMGSAVQRSAQVGVPVVGAESATGELLGAVGSAGGSCLVEAARNRLPSTSLGRRFGVSGQALISLVVPALSTPRETADFKVPTVRLASSTDCRGGWTLDT